MALGLDFTEQARILNRKHRLRREGLQQVHSPLRKFAGRFSTHHEGANDAISAEQWNDHARSIAGWSDDRPGAGGNIGVDQVAKSPPDGYMQIPAHRGQSFRRIADSIPVIADSF
jgi:Tripartite tricarboxylate transporter family receptor